MYGEPAGDSQPLPRVRRRVHSENDEIAPLPGGWAGRRRQENTAIEEPRRRKAEPGSVRLPLGAAPKLTGKLRPRKLKLKLGRGLRRGLAVALCCCGGLGALGLVSSMIRHHVSSPNSKAPIRSVVANLDDTARVPAEWSPTLQAWGLLGGALPARVDSVQEQNLLSVEGECGKLGAYPESSRFSGGWNYARAGAEMSLRGPGGDYDSLMGWSGGAVPVHVAPAGESSLQELHLSWNKGQCEDWLKSHCGLDAHVPESLQKIVLDYGVEKRQGMLCFVGVKLPASATKGAKVEFPENLWKALPATAQRAVFRPDVAESVLGADLFRRPPLAAAVPGDPARGFWSQFLLGQREEFVGFGVDEPLRLDVRGELTDVRTQVALMVWGRLPAFLMTASWDNAPMMGKRSLLEMSEPAPGLSLLSTPGLPIPAKRPAEPPADPKVAGPHQGDLAAGVSLLRLSTEQQVEIEWQAREVAEGLMVSFTVGPTTAVKAPDVALSGPDLERQHRTRTSVVAGR